MGILSKIDDKQLVFQLQKNNVEAFDNLFHKYNEKLYRFSFSLLKNAEDSKEIVQEVFLRIWEKRQNIDCSKSFKSFLFTVSYNLIVDQFRLKLKDQKYRESLIEYFDSEKLDYKSETDYENLVIHIKHAVEELPLKRRQIFILSRDGDFTNKEIAAQLGISVKTVESQITLALKHLKLRLGKEILPLLLFVSLFS